MPKINAFQTNFAAGELSPRMYARSDVDAYGSGLKECVNMITRPQGPVSKRPGLRFLANVPGAYARVFPFQLTAESDLGDAFPIVMSDNGQLFVYGATGSVAGEQQLANPSFDEGGINWTSKVEGTGSVSFVLGTAALTAPNNTGLVTEISQPFTVDVSEQNQEWSVDFVATSTNAPIHPVPYVKIGTAAGLSDITVTDGIFNTGTNTTLYVTVGVPGGNYDSQTIPGEPTLEGTYTRVIEDVTIRSATVFVGDLIFAHTWDAQDIKDAWYAMPPSGDAMYILTPRKRPYKLSNLGLTDSWAFDTISFIGKPSEWKDGSWPSCVTFFQGRAWWAGVDSAPEKIWSSVSSVSADQYERFRIGSLATDSVIITNAKRGKIRWMEGLRNLIFGTAYGEFIITSDSGVITPDDVRIEQQSANGSALSQTIPIGNTAIYTSGDKTKLRTANFQWTEQSWLSKDVTFTADHIGVNHNFESGTYARNPDDVVWFTMSDGTFSAMTFESFTQMAGWHRHNTTGDVQSLGSIEINGSSVVYAIVSRAGLKLEVMDDEVRLDSFMKSTNESPVSQLTGLTHLANLDVSLLIDGAMYAGSVDAGGVLNLPRAGRVIFAGLPFEARIKRLAHEGGSPMGTALFSSKRNVETSILVYDSVVPLVNGLRPNTRTSSTSMGSAQPLFTGYVDAKELGYTRDADLVITDNTPYPLNISGLYSTLNMEQQL